MFVIYKLVDYYVKDYLFYKIEFLVNAQRL